jgi:hypothetical protein
MKNLNLKKKKKFEPNPLQYLSKDETLNNTLSKGHFHEFLNRSSSSKDVCSFFIYEFN